MLQENDTLSVRVDMTHVGGKFHFNLSTTEGISHEMMRAILAGGLSLTIKAEEGPKKQGEAMKEVMDYLTSEFISTNSFENAKYVIPTTPPEE